MNNCQILKKNEQTAQWELLPRNGKTKELRIKKNVVLSSAAYCYAKTPLFSPKLFVFSKHLNMREQGNSFFPDKTSTHGKIVVSLDQFSRTNYPSIRRTCSKWEISSDNLSPYRKMIVPLDYFCQTVCLSQHILLNWFPWTNEQFKKLVLMNDGEELQLICVKVSLVCHLIVGISTLSIQFLSCNFDSEPRMWLCEYFFCFP